MFLRGAVDISSCCGLSLVTRSFFTAGHIQEYSLQQSLVSGKRQSKIWYIPPFTHRVPDSPFPIKIVIGKTPKFSPRYYYRIIYKQEVEDVRSSFRYSRADK